MKKLYIQFLNLGTSIHNHSNKYFDGVIFYTAWLCLFWSWFVLIYKQKLRQIRKLTVEIQLTMPYFS